MSRPDRSPDRVVVHLQLDKELVKAVDHLAAEEGCWRFQAAEMLIARGLRSWLDEEKEIAPEVRQAAERALSGAQA